MGEEEEIYLLVVNSVKFLERVEKYVDEKKINAFINDWFNFLEDIFKKTWQLARQEGKCFECALYEVMDADATVREMERIRKKYIKKEVEKELEKEKKRGEELTYIE